MAKLAILAEPWMLLDGKHPLVDTAQASLPGQGIEVSGVGAPSVMLSAESEKVPWFGRQGNGLPQMSFPFQLQGQEMRWYSLPLSCRQQYEEDVLGNVGLETWSVSICQTQALHRLPRRPGEEMSDDEKLVEHWLRWGTDVLQRVREKSVAGEALGYAAQACECSWSAVWTVLTEAQQRQAEYSLIVRLAEEHRLRDCCETIARHPRVVLERVREQMRVSRIQQLDGRCLRDLARRPGYDIATKAGPRQELLAIRRLETSDTLENRVFVWVLGEMQALGTDYVRAHGDFSDSGRVRAVRKFVSDVLRLRQSSSLAGLEVCSLVHPVVPNYPLQLDGRYKLIYDTYKRLWHQKKLLDDLWEWQRVFWGSVARLIFYALLHALAEERRIFRYDYVSSLFLCCEGQRGRWLLRGHAPGPFQEVRKGRLYHLVDCWDVDDVQQWHRLRDSWPVVGEMGQLGCDAFLYSPTTDRLMPIWFAFAGCSSDEFAQARLSSCLKALQSFARANASLNAVHGLIVSNVLGMERLQDVLTLRDSGLKVSANLVRVPDHLNGLMAQQLKDSVSPVLEEFFS